MATQNVLDENWHYTHAETTRIYFDETDKTHILWHLIFTLQKLKLHTYHGTSPVLDRNWNYTTRMPMHLTLTRETATNTRIPWHLTFILWKLKLHTRTEIQTLLNHATDCVCVWSKQNVSQAVMVLEHMQPLCWYMDQSLSSQSVWSHMKMSFVSYWVGTVGIQSEVNGLLYWVGTVGIQSGTNGLL